MHSRGRRARSPIVFLAVALCSSSCTLVSSLRGGPALFGGNVAVEALDFEQDPLHKPPEGFEPRGGRWSVADSPTAASGAQVVVESGDAAASLAVKKAEHSQAAAGEVAVRVLLGASGAGIGCEDENQGSGYVVKLEPSAQRIVLYRRAQDSMTPVATASAPIPKGEWVRLGIRCENKRVIGYLDGKPAVSDRASLGAVNLTLYSDPNVAAQFDDLKYWTRK